MRATPLNKTAPDGLGGAVFETACARFCFGGLVLRRAAPALGGRDRSPRPALPRSACPRADGEPAADARPAPNDLGAIGALTKLKDLNRRVPEDVAVIGHDYPRIAGWHGPALIIVGQPRHQMGQRAKEALLKRLGHPSDPAEGVAFETAPIVRRPSGSPCGLSPVTTPGPGGVVRYDRESLSRKTTENQDEARDRNRSNKKDL